MLYGLLFKWVKPFTWYRKICIYLEGMWHLFGKILNSEKSSDVSVVTLPAQKKTVPYVVVEVYANIV